LGNVELNRAKEIAAIVADHYNDPYGLVMALFPWGQEFYYDSDGQQLLNPLRDKTGPEIWQKEELLALGQHMRDNAIRVQIGLELKVWRSAYASGHGVGKSAFVAWIIIILMSTRVDTRGVVTASTQFQLEDKTWPELRKWLSLALNGYWFKWSASALSFAAYPDDKQKNYRTTAATVSEENTEAFQGLHNEGKTVFVLFDEASGVHNKIWEVSQGALTDGEAFFFALGNPTKPEGEFVDCFEKHTDLYRCRHIDSRDVTLTNKGALADTIKLYGIDSDEVRVRIRGLFPQQSYNGFFDVDALDRSMAEFDENGEKSEIKFDRDAALIMAIDVANTGPDETVIGFRQGWDARSIPMTCVKGLKTQQIVDLAAKLADTHRPDAIMLENVGPGVGVADLLVDRGYKVVRVFPGAPSKDEALGNHRMDNHWAFREWIYNGGKLQNDKQTRDQCRTIQYYISKTTGKTYMESKEDIKGRGLPSPDRLDMYSLTFAVRIARRDRNHDMNARRGRQALTQQDPTEL
jgi:hypothetical protein